MKCHFKHVVVYLNKLCIVWSETHVSVENNFDLFCRFVYIRFSSMHIILNTALTFQHLHRGNSYLIILSIKHMKYMHMSSTWPLKAKEQRWFVMQRRLLWPLPCIHINKVFYTYCIYVNCAILHSLSFNVFDLCFAAVALFVSFCFIL